MLSAVIHVQFVELTPFLLPSPIWLICTARYVLSALNINCVGTYFETFREEVGYLHFALLRRARKFDSYLLITGVIFLFVRLRQK